VHCKVNQLLFSNVLVAESPEEAQEAKIRYHLVRQYFYRVSASSICLIALVTILLSLSGSALLLLSTVLMSVYFVITLIARWYLNKAEKIATKVT
jgi:hypothetical protein